MYRLALVFLFSLICSAPLSATPGNGEYWEYTFRPGDTIWKIAQDHTNSVNNWSEIQRINQIAQGPDRRIQPGTRIKIPVSMLKQPPQPARIIAIDGTPSLMRANGNEESITLSSQLFSGDRVITGPGQSLRVKFADGSELQVLENTEVRFDKLSYLKDTGMVDTRIRLPHGRVNSRVEKLAPNSRYQIQTPAAITAVRGTQYRVATDRNQVSRTEVTEGSVAVSAGAITRTVETGFGLVAEPGQPLPEPVKLLAAPTPGANRARIPGALSVNWTNVDGAAAYRYRLAVDANFDRLLSSGTTEDTGISLQTVPGGTYHLGVRALDGNQLQGLEAVRRVTVSALAQGNPALEQVIIPAGVLLFNP